MIRCKLVHHFLWRWKAVDFREAFFNSAELWIRLKALMSVTINLLKGSAGFLE
jgi:hypothetical protein